MAKTADAVRDVVSRKREHGREFAEQIERHRKFKEKMREAGVEYGDKFEIPLMSRLGHTVKSK